MSLWRTFRIEFNFLIIWHSKEQGALQGIGRTPLAQMRKGFTGKRLLCEVVDRGRQEFQYLKELRGTVQQSAEEDGEKHSFLE